MRTSHMMGTNSAVLFRGGVRLRPPQQMSALDAGSRGWTHPEPEQCDFTLPGAAGRELP